MNGNLFSRCRPRALTLRKNSQVAADGSRRCIGCEKSAPTAVGGYTISVNSARCELSRLEVALLGALLLASCAPPARAQLGMLTNAEPQRTFAGVGAQISVRFHNPDNRPATADLRTRLYQAGSAIAAPWDDTPWKELTVLPGQTVLESAVLTFPPVKAETRFLVQWLRRHEQGDRHNRGSGVSAGLAERLEAARR